jgi:uncharacterized membrane protein YfcA
MPGIVIGSLIATKVPEAALRLTLATVLAVVASQLLLPALDSNARSGKGGVSYGITAKF